MMAEEVLEKLRKVREPETGESIVDLGIVTGVKVDEEVTVYVRFNMPSCKACLPIAWMVVRAILREIDRVLAGLKYKVVDDLTGEVYWRG